METMPHGLIALVVDLEGFEIRLCDKWEFASTDNKYKHRSYGGRTPVSHHLAPQDKRLNR